jgi:hypothetical protein
MTKKAIGADAMINAARPLTHQQGHEIRAAMRPASVVEDDEP